MKQTVKKLLELYKNTWKYQLILVVILIILFCLIFFLIEKYQLYTLTSNHIIIVDKLIDNFKLPFQFASRLLLYGEAYSNKFTLDNSNWNDFINLSGLKSIFTIIDIDELRFHYIINDTYKPYYENFMSTQLNRNITIFQVVQNNTFLYQRYDTYCPLTYISPNVSDVLYQYIGADICHTPTYKNYTDLLKVSNKIEIQSRTIIRDNSTILFDIGKKTNNSFVILSVLVKKFIEGLQVKVIGDYYIEIIKDNITLYTNLSKNNQYNFTNIYNNKIIIYDSSINVNILFYDTVDYSYLYYTIPIIIISWIIISSTIVYLYNNINLQNKLHQYEYSNDLLGYVNHELRNPLNSIQGLIHLSLDDIKLLETRNNDIKDSIESNLQTAEKSCLMINHIVNDILDMTRLQKNMLILNYEHILVDDLFTDIRKILIHKINEFNDIKLEFETNIKSVYIDKYRITQILLNFITNSYKFTSRGFIKISIINTNNIIKISVRDTGIGISKDKINVLFKPYEQVNVTDSLRHGGMGLGLYICKMLSDLMQIKIDFNNLDVGCEFYIEFQSDESMSPPEP